MESSPTSSQPGGDRTAEILTLVLRLLEGDPRLSASFQQLRSDVEASALPRHSVDWQGSATPLPYARALQRLGDAAPAPTQLQSLLGRLMELTLQSVDASSRLPSIPLSLLRSDGLSIASTGTNGEAWSAAYRRQLSLFQETCLRGRAAASSTTLLLAREIGARVPGRARPPRYCFSSAISDLGRRACSQADATTVHVVRSPSSGVLLHFRPFWAAHLDRLRRLQHQDVGCAQRPAAEDVPRPRTRYQ